jgi:hypothetical protein
MKVTMKSVMVALVAVLSSPLLAQAVSPRQKQGQSSRWEFSNRVDPMTDVASFSASRRGDAGRISIDCKRGDRGSVTVLVGSDRFLGSNRVGMRELTYRLDQSSAVEGRWAYSGQAAMLTNTEQAAALLMPMMRASRLLVRMYAYDGSSVDILFDVTGTAEVVRQLLANCQIGQG